MRIVVVSNVYPPYSVGGYEIGCRDIVEGLTARGHDVSVLTSTFGLDAQETAGNIHRLLRTPLPYRKKAPSYTWTERIKIELHDQQVYRKLLRRIKPDVVYFWNMSHLPAAFMCYSMRCRHKVAYYISEQWPLRWRTDFMFGVWEASSKGTLRRMDKVLFVRALDKAGWLPFDKGLSFYNAQFTSDFLRRNVTDGGETVKDSVIIHWGVDLQKFPAVARRAREKPRRFLFVGALAPHKGVHTAIEAFDRLCRAENNKDIELTICGGTMDLEYEQRLKKMAEGISGGRVSFTGALPREAVSTLYAEHDVLIFPSVWPEPFSIALVEAMSSQIAIVTTTTGGSAEIVRDGVNALVFEADNSSQCADRIQALLNEPRLAVALGEEARRTVEERFTLEAMVGKIEDHLRSVYATL